ncbi:type VII secretion system-associated protein [Streptomyces sp. NPDC002870]|uniref:type VII secretion system-associated protein n=1 Tax=Streptomyces sp. NPDC002870 TaxID=3364666 RepID=UPI0036B26F92
MAKKTTTTLPLPTVPDEETVVGPLEKPGSQPQNEHIPVAPVGAQGDDRGAAGAGDDGGQADATTTGPDSDPPPIPDAIREAARLAPDHWLGMVDPTWSGEGPPPEWALVGQWRSGLDGEIEEWRDNPEYRPSPNALGWPEPEDEVDEAIQLAATGYGPGEAVGESLVGREVAVLVKPGGGVLFAAAPDGEAVVPLFTSPVFLHTAGRLAFEVMNVNDLVHQVPEGHLLYLNPSAPVSMTLELDVMRAAVESANSPAPSVPTVSGDAEEEPEATVSGDAVEEPEATLSGGAVEEPKATLSSKVTDALTAGAESGEPRGSEA